MELTLGHTTYRLVTVERDGQWAAHAVLADTGERYGIEIASESEWDAIERLRLWLDWQHEHTKALHDLQETEAAYHRAVAGTAFSAPADAPVSEERRLALAALNAARLRLDELRARRPNP